MCLYQVFVWRLPSLECAEISLQLEADSALLAMLQAMHAHQLTYVDYASAWPLTDEHASAIRCSGLDRLGHALETEVL